MVRTQIQLTEEQAKALKMLAHAQNVSMAELIRQSLDEFIWRSENRQPDREEMKRRAVAAIGRFNSGLPDVSREHDKYLAEDYLT